MRKWVRGALAFVSFLPISGCELLVHQDTFYDPDAGITRA